MQAEEVKLNPFVPTSLYQLFREVYWGCNDTKKDRASSALP
jgi:hypothetical protein